MKSQDKGNEYEREREKREGEKKWVEYCYINPISYNYSTKYLLLSNSSQNNAFVAVK